MDQPCHQSGRQVVFKKWESYLRVALYQRMAAGTLIIRGSEDQSHTFIFTNKHHLIWKKLGSL